MEHVVQNDVDKYVIVEYLAEGGMGAIFLGKKIGMGGFEKDVVLKQLLPEYTEQPEFIDLFLREAKLSAALDHANIVHTIDLVKAGGDYFIVMEYVRGGDLRAILRRIKHRGFQLDPGAALFIAREILSALAYAHEKKNAQGVPLKLIHRDVSPSNIMVSAAGEVKLADFGIAKASTHKSVFYKVKGKIGYMSPEQAVGATLDRRSDLYSLAVCLHEMVSGERLFVADLLSTPEQIYNQRIPPVEGLPGVPRGLDAVLARALARKPDDRYQTALELQDALVQVAYDSAMLVSSPELAAHLHKTCGSDPTTWNTEPEDGDQPSKGRPGTEVLAEEAAQFSGVELTSIFTGLALGTGPESAEIEPTRPISLGSIARAAPPFEVGARLDERQGTPAPTYSEQLETVDERARLVRPPPAADQPDFPPIPRSDSWGGPTRNESGAWTDDEQDALTVSIDQTGPGSRKAAPLLDPDPAPVLVARSGERELPRADASQRSARAPQSRDREGRPRVEQEPELELERPARTRTPEPEQRPRPLEEEPLADGPPAPAPPRAKSRSHDSVRHKRREESLTARVREERQERRIQRLLVLIVTLLLLSASAAIVAVVGLTGPSLDDSRPKKDPFLGQPAVVVDAAPRSTEDLTPSRPPDQGVTDSGAERLGQLKVTSTPAHASVLVDNVPQCESPCTVDELRPGRIYLLSVRRKNYVSWSSLVELGQRRALAVNAFLSEEPDPRKVGYLTVRSTPPAEVLVDGKTIGRVTSEGRIPLPPGQYEISLSHPRRAAQPRQVVSIRAGQTVVLTKKF